MPRKKTKSLRRDISPDHVYKSILVARFIGKVMLSGKKRLAERLVYNAIANAGAKLNQDPLVVFETALNNVYPQMEVRSKRVGGANYQVPIEVGGDRKIHLGMIWVIKAARSKKGKAFDECLSQELIDAFNNTGEAVKKKEETHKMAESNRAFAHFARF